MRKKHSSSLGSKLFILLAVACIGFISFGVYVYIQDRNNNVIVNVNKNNQTAPDQLNNDLSQEENQSDNQDDNSLINPNEKQDIKKLDKITEHDIKTEIAQNNNQKPTNSNEGQGDASQNIQINVNFSSYVEGQQNFSTAFMFVGQAATQITNCSLELKAANSGKGVTQNAEAINQQEVVGCRFNQINFEQLPQPSNENNWSITLAGLNSDNKILINKKFTINNLKDLNKIK